MTTDGTHGATFRIFGRVELRASWARRHATVAVAFSAAGGQLGWHACLMGDEGAVLLTFPWYDHADRILRGESRWESFPTRVPDEEWSDLEQGWFGWVNADEGFVYLAEGDPAEMLGVRSRKIELARPGVVTAEGVEISWNSVPCGDYERAWKDAAASCRAGAPFPVGEWTAEPGATVRVLG